MTIKDTYDLLVEIANRENVKPDAFRKWQKNGVPYKFQALAWDTANRRKIDIEPWVFANFREAEQKSKAKAA